MTVSIQIKSKIYKEGLLTITLDEVNVPEPGDGEVPVSYTHQTLPTNREV